MSERPTTLTRSPILNSAGTVLRLPGVNRPDLSLQVSPIRSMGMQLLFCNIANSNTAMNYYPLNHYILLRPRKLEAVSTGGIIIPETTRDTTTLTQGTIEDLGPNTPKNFFLGQTVLFKQHTEYHLKIDGEDFLLVSSDDILMASAPTE